MNKDRKNKILDILMKICLVIVFLLPIVLFIIGCSKTRVKAETIEYTEIKAYTYNSNKFSYEIYMPSNFVHSWDEAYCYYEIDMPLTTGLILLGQNFATTNAYLYPNTNLLFEATFLENYTISQIPNDEDFFTNGRVYEYQIYSDSKTNGYLIGIKGFRETKTRMKGVMIIKMSLLYWENGVNEIEYLCPRLMPIRNEISPYEFNGYTTEEYLTYGTEQRNIGYRDGKEDGIEEGITQGYDDAMEDIEQTSQYQLGFQAGERSNSIKIGQVIASVFSGMTGFFNLEIFNGITLGGLFLLPVIFGALWVVLKILRG